MGTGTILIVDDTAANRQLLERLIGSTGHTVIAAENGHDALDIAVEQVPDLILLDINMPGLTGYDVCQRLKEMESTCDIPVVFLSALDHMDDKLKGFSLGAVDYITKPIDPDEVKARVQTHVEMQLLRSSLADEVNRRREAEASLRRINEELEQRIAKRTAALIRSNEQLEAEIRERSRAEVALMESRARYQTLFDDSPISLWVEDFSAVKRYLDQLQKDGMTDLVAHLLTHAEVIEACVERVTVDVVNQATLDLIGHDSNDDLYETLGNIEAEETIEVWRGQLIALLEGHTPYETMFTFSTRDGDRVHTVLRVSIAEGYEDSWALVLVSMLDVTELKLTEFALREREERLEAFAAALPDPAGILSEDGILLDVFTSHQQALAFTANHIGHHLRELFGREVASHLTRAVRDTLETNTTQTIEFQFELDGRRRWLEGRIAPMEAVNGEQRRVVWMVRDITAREEARTARQDTELLRLELDKERELSDLKSRFVSMASHEFRTPLTTVRSSADLLGMYLDRYLEGEQYDKVTKHITKIQTSVQHITELLDDVLTIGRAESRGLDFEPEPMDLTAFCEDIIEEIRLSASEAHTIAFTVKGTPETTVLMDPKLLRHVFTNLLSNAVKYSPQGGEVAFSLIWEPETVHIHVSDSGIGIPQKDQVRLFEPFHRARNARALQGTGLGLAITKTSVETHGGSIDFESIAGEGTTFFVTLPIE